MRSEKSAVCSQPFSVQRAVRRHRRESTPLRRRPEAGARQQNAAPHTATPSVNAKCHSNAARRPSFYRLPLQPSSSSSSSLLPSHVHVLVTDQPCYTCHEWERQKIVRMAYWYSMARWQAERPGEGTEGRGRVRDGRGSLDGAGRGAGREEGGEALTAATPRAARRACGGSMRVRRQRARDALLYAIACWYLKIRYVCPPRAAVER